MSLKDYYKSDLDAFRYIIKWLSIIFIIGMLILGLRSYLHHRDEPNRQSVNLNNVKANEVIGESGDRVRVFTKWKLKDGTVCYVSGNYRSSIMGCVK